MANKKTRQEKEQAEEQRKEQMKKDHEIYVTRIEARIEKGENIERENKNLKPLEVLPYEKWVRKVKRDVNGQEVEVEVSGDSGETGNERFKRLAKARMKVAIKALKLIGNLSSSQYDSTSKEQDDIINALKLKVHDIETAFKVKEEEAEEEFNFSEDISSE